MPQNPIDWDARIEDAMFMLEAGEYFDHAARRLGLKPVTLEKQLDRRKVHGFRDTPGFKARRESTRPVPMFSVWFPRNERGVAPQEESVNP